MKDFLKAVQYAFWYTTGVVVAKRMDILMMLTRQCHWREDTCFASHAVGAALVLAYGMLKGEALV